LRFPARIFTVRRPELNDVLTTIQAFSTMRPADLRTGLDRGGAFGRKLRDIVYEWCFCNAAFRRTVTRRAERGQPIADSAPDTPVEHRRDTRRHPGNEGLTTAPDQRGALSPARPPRSQASSRGGPDRSSRRDNADRDSRPAPVRHNHPVVRDSLGARSRSGR